MMMTQKTRSTRARKPKIADAIAKHEDVEVRLAASFLQNAIKHAKDGDLIRMLACIRLSAEYEAAVPATTKQELYING
jgi:hypothetical protein